MDTVLLPGFGQRTVLQVDVADTETGTTDVIDCSHVSFLCFHIKQFTEGGAFSVQAKESFDGVNWNNLGAAMIAVGASVKLDPTDGPFGLVKFEATWDGDASDSSDPASSSSDSTFTPANVSTIDIEVIGWPLPLA